MVVEKPAGMAVQTGRLTEKDLVNEIKNHLSLTGKRSNPYLGIIHRLDQPVRGILVFALNEKSASVLSKQIQTGSFNKCYLALVEGLIEGYSEWITLTDYLIKDKDNIAKTAGKDNRNAKKAELRFKKLRTDEEAGVTLLEIELITGRFHQIRAQMSNMGHPIVNDVKYGAKASLSYERSIALCAYKLIFKHPTDGREMVFKIEEDFGMIKM
jgi:23S rRNA pseudouridine1911/1915/1917 synthase